MAEDFNWQYRYERGLEVVIAYKDTFIAPYCTIWVMRTMVGKKCVAHIIDSHTPEWARRKGARSFLNDVLFEHFSVHAICTASGTPLGSKFMNARGYRRGPLGDWYLTKQDWKAEKRKRARK